MERVREARKAAEASNVSFFINARCDLFFQTGDSVPHDEELLAKAIERAQAYAEAGAYGFFVPGLTKISLISTLAQKLPVPINILADSTTSIRVSG